MLAIPAKDATALAWNCWYLINKDYVARELCINKAKPKLHCNGKCHLAKQLKKLEDPSTQEKKTANTTIKPSEVYWISQQKHPVVVLSEYVEIPLEQTWFLQNRAPQSVSFPVFHPPCC